MYIVTSMPLEQLSEGSGEIERRRDMVIMVRYSHIPRQKVWRMYMRNAFDRSALFLCLNSLFCLLQRCQPLPRPHLVPKGWQHIGDVL